MLKSAGMFVTLVDDCNLDCKFCKFPGKKEFRSGKELDYEKFVQMLRQSKEMPPDIPLGSICFCGSGEPLLYHNVVGVVKEAKKYVPQVSIVTNGILLSEHVCQELLKADINHIVVSITGINDHVYEKFQGSGYKTKNVKDQLNLVKKNVRMLVEMRDSMRTNTQIGISYILDENSQKDYFLALQYWNHIGVNYVDTRILQKGFTQKTENFDPYIKYNKQWWGDENVCTCFGKVMNVFTDGRIGFCNCAYKEETILGNLYDSSLKEILNSVRFKELLHSFSENYNSIPELCKTCDMLKARPILA